MAAGEVGGAAVRMGMTGGHKLVCLAISVLALGEQGRAQM
jgi:hypothetical protein